MQATFAVASLESTVNILLRFCNLKNIFRVKLIYENFSVCQRDQINKSVCVCVGGGGSNIIVI